MRINNNIQALNAYRNLSQNQNATSKNLEKLSSGLRINRASDDAAGLAISEKMRSQIRGLKMAERNAMDAISLMQTSEGAMQEVHSMLQRMRELAVQGANDTNTDGDRAEIQKEIDQLLTEVDSIADKTEFNTRKLLNGESAVLTTLNEGGNSANIKGEPTVVNPNLRSGNYGLSVQEPASEFIVSDIRQPAAGFGEDAEINFSNRSEGNQLGVYTINVRDYQSGSETEPPSATIQVSGPDGLPRDETIAVKVGDPNSSVDIGGLNIPLDSIDKSGTVKVSLEAKANFTVWQEQSNGGGFRELDFDKEMTTINGKIVHGGIEFNFDSSIKPSFPFLKEADQAALEEATNLITSMDQNDLTTLSSDDIIDEISTQVISVYNDNASNDISDYEKLNDNLKDSISMLIDPAVKKATIDMELTEAKTSLVDAKDAKIIKQTKLEEAEAHDDIVAIRTAEENVEEAELARDQAEAARDAAKVNKKDAEDLKENAEEAYDEDETIELFNALSQANTTFDEAKKTLEKKEEDLLVKEAELSMARTSVIDAKNIALDSELEPSRLGTLDEAQSKYDEAVEKFDKETLLVSELEEQLQEAQQSFDSVFSAVGGGTEFSIINNALAFQIGPNTNQNVMIDVPELNVVELGIDQISVRTQSEANDAIFSLDDAIQNVSSIRAKLGAVQNRMEHTINNLQVTHENLTSAESRIRDADMALEMTEFTRNNILNQSATAMLAQANQLPQGVLQLLQ